MTILTILMKKNAHRAHKQVLEKKRYDKNPEGKKKSSKANYERVLASETAEEKQKRRDGKAAVMRNLRARQKVAANLAEEAAKSKRTFS
jgi:hypothetical protein